MRKYLKGVSTLLAGVILTSCCLVNASAYNFSKEATEITLYAEEQNASSQFYGKENKYDIKSVDLQNEYNTVSLVDKNYFDNAEKAKKQNIKKNLKEEYENKKQIVFYGNGDNLSETEILDTLGEENTIKTELTDDQKNALTAITMVKDFDGSYIMTKYFDYTASGNDNQTISAMLDRVLDDNYSQQIESQSISPQSIIIDPKAGKNGNKMRYLNRYNTYDVSLYYLWIRRGYDSNHTEWELKLCPSISMNSNRTYQTSAATITFNNGTANEDIMKSYPPTTHQTGSSSESVTGSINSKLDVTGSNSYAYTNNWSSQSVVQRKVDNDPNSVQWVVAVKRDTAEAVYGTQVEVGSLISNKAGACSVRTNFELTIVKYGGWFESDEYITDSSPLLINIPDLKVSK